MLQFTRLWTGACVCMGVHFLCDRSQPQHIIYFTEHSGAVGAGDSNFSNVRTYICTYTR